MKSGGFHMDFMKSGGFHMDFMKSSGFHTDFMKSGGFHVKSKDLLQGIVTLCFCSVSTQVLPRGLSPENIIYTLCDQW